MMLINALKKLLTFVADENFKSKAIIQSKTAKYIAVLTPIAFLIDIAAMLKFNLAGGYATALVGGTAIIIMLLTVLTSFKIKDGFEMIVDYIKEGFKFGMNRTFLVTRL